MQPGSASISARANIVHPYYPREMAPALQRFLQHMPVVVLTGMRQVGKTTMLVNDPLFQDRTYATLEDGTVATALSNNPAAFLDSYEKLTLDEAQRAPGIGLAVRQAVRRKKANGRYLLSGSSALDVKRTAESMAGDALYLRMHPFNRRELNRKTGEAPFLIDFISAPRLVQGNPVDPVRPEEVLRGGIPGVALASPEAAQAWLLGYEQTYLERDILYLKRIQHLQGFRDLLKLLASRTAQLLNVHGLAGDLSIPNSTVQRYVDLLRELFVVETLPAYSRSVSVSTRKHPKVLIADSALACYLAGVTDLAHHLGGFMYETYIHQNLASIIQAHASDWDMYYWRDARGREVDFVIDTRSQVIGIEVKSSETLDRGDAAALRVFMANTPDCRLGILAFNGSTQVNLGEGIWAVPLGLLLS